MNENGIYNKFYSLHTLHTHTYNIDPNTPAQHIKIVPGPYTSLLPSAPAAHQLGEFSYVTVHGHDSVVINPEACKLAQLESSLGCMRMKPNQMVQYFNDDGFSFLSSVSPGVYLVTLLAITSWQVLCTVFNSNRPADKTANLQGKDIQMYWFTWRQIIKRSLQMFIIIFWAISLVKYSSVSGVYAETWDNYDNTLGGKLYEMQVSLYQSTNLASILVCVFAFLLCVWSNVGNSVRWSKMNWVLKQNELMQDYEMLPTQSITINSMFSTGPKKNPDTVLATNGFSSSMTVEMPATSTNDTIVFYAFVLFFAFIQLIAARSSVCLETHLQCFAGVTLLFIIVELAWSKMSEFLWELEAEMENATYVIHGESRENFVQRAKKELMHVHYVAFAIRLFVCIFEIILFRVAQELFLADGDGLNGFFHIFFVLGIIYVSINLLVALLQALGVVMSAAGLCTQTAGTFIPMLWQQQDGQGRTQRKELRSYVILAAPIFYVIVLIFTMAFCFDQIFTTSDVTKTERQLYNSLTQQYLKANNYIQMPILQQSECRNSVPKQYTSEENCYSDGKSTCGARYLTNTTQMMLIQPATDLTFENRLNEAKFQYNTWVKFIDPFHLKIGFWTKFFEIKKVAFIHNEQTKWTATGADKYGVLCHNFFALGEGVDCSAAAEYQRDKMK